MIVRATFYSLFTLMFFHSVNVNADSNSCNGKFPHPINDYCWSAIFPIKIAGIDLSWIGKQEDNDSKADAICSCGDGIAKKIGVANSFWEPTSMVEVVRKPYCMSGLGGTQLDVGVDAPESKVDVVDGGSVAKSTFHQVHLYQNPLLYWMEVGIDNSCIDTKPFELLYLTELDPLWDDDDLTNLLSPEAYLFANPAAILACTGDCVATSAGFPNDEMFWCAGCQGGVFPLTGTTNTANTGVIESSSLLLQKFLHKAHRELMLWGTSGKDGMCHKYPKYLIDKTDYKYSMLFPTPQKKVAGKCGQPLGRTTALWGAGSAFPYKGEDMVYQLFKKNDCCAGQKGLEDL